jgi:enoyl-CoA hydratase/carnithine racemase
MAGQSTVVSEIEDSIALVRLNRPEKLNAFTFEMIAAIRAAIDRAAGDERAVAIVITGTGPAFSAGLDTGDLKRSASGATPEEPETGDADELPALFGYLLRIPKPVIAAINGVAAGGGFVLAMMCDLRFASDDSSFTTAFSKRGLIAEHGTSWLLPRLVGTSSALDLLWSARRIDSDEALRIGFVDRVVPRARLLDEVRAYVRELAANVSPRSLAVIKSQIYRHWSLSMESALDDADQLMKQALGHPDAAEGVASFIERRSPRFQRYKGEKP